MSQKPLLIFSKKSSASKSKRNPSNFKQFWPDKEQQVQRIGPSIRALEQVLQNQTAYLANGPENLVPEMILVFEVAGTIDNFFNAVGKTPGMEFLAEYRSEFEPDEYFSLKERDGGRSERKLDSRIFLTMTNRRALQELLSYWKLYQKNETFVKPFSKFRLMFEQLKEIRPYGVADRIKDTGLLEDILYLKRNGEQIFHFEIELAYKEDLNRNNAAFREVETLINQSGGEILKPSRTLIREIGYHAFIAKAPITSFDDISENTAITFLKSQQILFFRPVGQSIYSTPHNQEEIAAADRERQVPDLDKYPVIALLDGVPLENHNLLQGRLIVDDPDDFSLNYLADFRNHGTAMSSLIIHGDLSSPNQTPISRPLYVRPIMKALPSGEECLPFDKLPIDLVHNAIKRMLSGTANDRPTAPGIKIINFSIGDINRPFHRNLSTWAKLLDWLSYKYNILFIVSAGNYNEHINLKTNPNEFDGLSAEQKQEMFLSAIIDSNFNRKILTPAESINALTVGSNHQDDSVIGNFPQRLNLINDGSLLSSYSRIGFGFNGSVKPEILMSGGRKLFRKPLVQPNPESTLLRVEDNTAGHAPGNLVAIVGSVGSLNSTGFSCGTSNSTALTTRLASQLYEMLEELNGDREIGRRIPIEYFAVIIKCLIIHGASWGSAQTILKELLLQSQSINVQTVKKHIFPYLGFGSVNSQKILYCTEQRVTLIGFGKLNKGKAHEYGFPLPPSIGQQVLDKKLTISLAWISPLNFKSGKYRQAHLYFDNTQDNEHLALSRHEYDFRAGQKGTVQHDVLVGNHADTFIDGTDLLIKVSCREDASGLKSNTDIRYSLCVTLEINENVATEIYEEVKQRLEQRVNIPARQRVNPGTA